MADNFIRASGNEVIAPGVSVGGKGRVPSSDERNARSPCVVEFRGGFVELALAAESSYGKDDIHIVVVMPVFRAADIEGTSHGVKQVLRPFRGL